MNTRKYFRLIVGAALFAMASLSALAQSGLDYFYVPRTVLVTPVKTILYSATGVGGYTNNAIVDIHPYIGLASLDVTWQTNVNAGTMQISIETSSDQVTWLAVSNMALAASQTVIYTNMFYGTNGLTATNTYLLPGTLTTPTASTAGFASPYTLAAPFTNNSPQTILAGVTHFGFYPDQVLKYFRINWLPGGTSTNATIAATITGRVSAGNP